MNKTGTEKRFLLVSIVPHKKTKRQVTKDIAELNDLVTSYEGEVVEVITQRREVHDKGMYIGRGKIAEVSRCIVDKDIDVIVFNGIVKPTQIYDLYTIFEKRKRDIQVWDRVDLILKIFSKHAHTTEARLQIELAAMHHMGPRIYGMGYELSRQGGGLGTRGIGETNTEIMKRHLRVQKKSIKDKLKKLENNRQLLVERRKKIGLPTVSLIGYTNAGKTSLFNVLTNKKKLVRNALFVTLDSSVGKLYLKESGKEVLLSDTIGFIRNLPPELIDAFRSTLMESLHSALLLHIIDVSDPDRDAKVAVVEKVLSNLKLQNKERLYVFNKIDKANGLNKDYVIKKYYPYNPQFTSTKTGEGVAELMESISRMMMR